MVLIRGFLGCSLTLALLAIAGAPSSAKAQAVFNWDPPDRGNVFSTPTNWTPVGPPGPTGEARFNTTDSAYSVSFSNDPTNARLRVGNDHVTLNLNGHTYTLTTTSTSSPSIMVGGITLADDALLRVTDGTLSGQHAVIAPAIFQTAAGMVVDTGGTLNLAGTFTVGKQKPGSLTIQNGGDVTSATGVLGESGAGDGSVTVTGVGSTWSNSGSVYVGGQAAIDGGNGTLSITNQGLVDVGGTLKLWPGGTVALNGGTLRIQTIQVAGGSFNWTSGTLHLGSELNVEPSGLLGGSLAVGAGKVLEVDGNFYVGNVGNGTLDISSGGQVNSLYSVIGGAGSQGQVHVEGMQSVWSTRDLTLGAGGTGSLDITNGARVTALNGTISAGTVTVDGAGSKWSVFGQHTSVQVGGNGSLDITNGADVEVFSLQPSLGQLSIGGSMGTINVDGAGSSLANQPGSFFTLYVGQFGNGTLNIINGGSVQGFSSVTIGGGGVGAVNVDGPGSSLASSFASSSLLFSVGAGGTLSIVNGGTVYGDGAGVQVNPLGEIRGDGHIVGNLENGGLVSPGKSPGALNLTGSYIQTPTGQLLIELASSSSYDQLLITDVATLNGTLAVNLLDGFVPSIGQSFTFLMADDVDGAFATEMLPSVPGLIFDVIYNPQSVVLTISPAFTADFDEDGDVDGDDLTQWQGDFGVNALSDADNDGDSDGADLLAWQQQLGSGSAGASSSQSAVPEPAARGLALVGLSYMCVMRRRRG